MEMTGEYRIQAPRERVWAALNDPEVLKAAIPGCEELVMESPTEMTAKVRAKVGPVSARFAGKVTLTDIDPPNGYRISGEGSGGVAGFAKGGAKVGLTADGDATIMRYDVSAQVGGKLAQIGSRLIDGTAKQMANEFFTKFAKAAETYTGGDAAPAAAAPAPVVQPAGARPDAALESAELPDGAAVPVPPPAAAPAAPRAPAAPVAASEPMKPAAAEDQAELPDSTPVSAPAIAAAPAPQAQTPVQAEPEVQPQPPRPSPQPAPAPAPQPAPQKGMSPLVWVVGVIVAAAAILYFATR